MFNFLGPSLDSEAEGMTKVSTVKAIINHFEAQSLPLSGVETDDLRMRVHSFTKPPLLQESRFTGGGSPNLVDLVERKVPVESNMGAANSFH